MHPVRSVLALSLLVVCSDFRAWPGNEGWGADVPEPVVAAGAPTPAGPGALGEEAPGTMTCIEAVETKTSVGCEYWAVDMDNLFLPQGRYPYSDAPIGASVHGYDQYVSYAYSAGLNLESLRARPLPP